MDALAKLCPKCGRRYDTAAAFCQKDGVKLQLTDEQPDPYIGTTLLDQFKIEEQIGAGGMGTVYRARQTTLHRDVAIKILHPELADNRDAVRRFKREARVSTALDHPNVVRVFLFGQLADGSLYIVMEFLRGRSLLEVIGRDGALPVHRALHIATQICDGVGEAHAHGVVHRDIKPENIVLVAKSRDPDTVKVLDFGIARVLWGDEQTQATQSGLVFGTARYISPEGAAGEATDARSDVYSLGVLTYQLLCGETPFDAPSPVAMLMKHIHATPPHLLSNERARHVPKAVADVVMRGLAKNADARFEDAQAFGDALRAAAESSGFEPNVRRRTSTAPPIERQSIERQSEEAKKLVSSRPPPPVEPTPPMRESDRPSKESSTLAEAPSPFADGEDVSIPGLPAIRRSTGSARSWRIVGGAFLFGVLLVGMGFGIAAWAREPSPRIETVSPIDRWRIAARTALDQGHFDEPREGSVLELTDRILDEHEGDVEALHMREDAAERLVSQAASEAARGERERARATYQRALAFRPGDVGINSAIAALEPVPAAPPGVRTQPLWIVEGREVTFVAVLAPDEVIGARTEPRFVLKRGDERHGSPIAARALPDGRTFEARYTLAEAGEYELLFRIGSGADRIEMATRIEVARDNTRPARVRPERDPPPVTTQGSAWTPPPIAPAWTNTPVVQPPEPDPPPPPAPWTGGGSVL